MLQTPLKEKINTTPTYGYFQINRIEFQPGINFYYNVQLLATNKDDIDSLKVWSTEGKFKDVVKCCWTTGLQVAKRLNGFARVIHYQDNVNDGLTPASAF